MTKQIVPTNLKRNQVVAVDVENDMLGAHDLNARRHFDVSAIATLSVLAFDHASHNVSRHQRTVRQAHLHTTISSQVMIL